MKTLGIDIGGTFIKYGTFEAGGKLRDDFRVPTPSTWPDFCRVLEKIIADESVRSPLVAVGVGVPGFIDRRTDRILVSPNMHFLDNVVLRQHLQSRTGLPVVVENDANCAAYGEYMQSPEPRPASWVHLTLGTGLGSGIVCHGRLWHGQDGFAGEFGHITLEPQGRSCDCGSRGCSETECSATAIVNNYLELTATNEERTAEQIALAARDGDGAAVAALARAGRYLGILLADIVNMLNPAVITLGGGVMAAAELILIPAREEFRLRIHPAGFERTEIRKAVLGNRAGMTGAAFLAQLHKS